MSVKLGDTVGAYRIVGELGAGGSGRVFRAQHTITGRVEALKVLSDSGAPGSERAERFLKEIRLQAKLDHPNIAIVHNAFWLDQTLVMVMEFVEGTSLRELLATGPLATGSVLEYGRQALDALAYTHDNDVTHRDISPSNILITPDGDVKLTDFGLASITADPAEIKDGRLMGSAYYMSPEQVKSAADLDHRTDIYALGVVLYEALTGTRPFEADDVFSVMEAHVETRPEAPSKRNPRLSRSVDTVILKALEKDREKRFTSVREFAKALDGLQGNNGAGTLPVPEPAAEDSAVTPRSVPRSRPVLERWVLQGLAGFAAVLVIALFAMPWFWSEPPVEPAEEPSAATASKTDEADVEPERVSESVLALGAESDRPVGSRSDAVAAAAQPPPAVIAEGEPLDAPVGRPSPLQASAGLHVPPPVFDPSADGSAVTDKAETGDPTAEPFVPLNVLDAGGPVEVIALSSDGRSVAGATRDGQIGVWDTSGDKMATLQGHEGRVTSLAFSPDGQRVASGGVDGTAKVWDIAKQREVRTLGHKGPVTAVAFSPDGLRLATGSDDKAVSVWDLSGQGAFREYRGHKSPARAIAFSPDGRRLVSAAREVRLWGFTSEVRPETLEGLPEDASAVAFSRDGAALAVAGVNQIGVWDLESGRRRQTVRVPGATYALTFAAPFRGLAVSATGGPSGDVKLWDLANPDPLLSLSVGGVLRSVAVTESAGMIAAAGDEGRIAIWRKSPGYLTEPAPPGRK